MIRLFRTLLCLYPAEFRDHFGREMCLVLSDRLGERHGFAGNVAICAGAAVDVLTGAPREHFQMIRQDLIYAWRTMRHEKLTTITAVLVLALGIGSTTTIFTLVNGFLLRPLPFPEQDRLVYVEEGRRGPVAGAAVAFPNYLDLRARNVSLEEFALFTTGMATLRGNGDAERIPAATVTATLFRVLGVQPILGRTFTADEDRPDGPKVVMLSEELWQRRYGGDPGIVGKTIDVGSAPARIVGIMPRGFLFPNLEQMWVPLQADPRTNKRTDYYLEGIARLKPGVSVQRAEADLRSIMRQISRENPTETTGQSVNVAPYRERVTLRVRPVLLALMGAVGFVLLIACGNIANLLLVKAGARYRETALRAALGASRSRLARQFVAESALLGLLGAAGGVLLAWASVPAMLSLVPSGMPGWLTFAPDARLLASVILVTAGTAVAAGLAPAVSSFRANLVDASKEGGRSATSGRAGTWFRAWMVIAEVAMSVFLLVGAGLMIRTFLNLAHQDAGLRMDSVITFQTAPPAQRYPPGAAALQLVRHVRAELASLPGVISVAGSSGAPFLDTWGRSLTVEGWPVLSLKDAPLINHAVVTRYFHTLGIPILEGRDFDDNDGKNPLVTIVDAGLARHYWPNLSALGKRVRYGPPEYHEPWHTVIGVVAEARNQSLRELRRNSVYLPIGEFGFAGAVYLVRTAGGMPDPQAAIRARMAQIDRGIAVSRMLTMHEIRNRMIWRERFFALLLTFFAGLALLLALVGLYGVMAYSIVRRTHEIGVRMALGASAGEIGWMILAQSGRLVLAGLVLGTAGAIMLTRALAAQLYGVAPGDPGICLLVAGLLSAAALIAGDLPARKATRLDPMLALRRE